MTFDEAKNILINRGFIEVNGYQMFDRDKWRNAIAVISKWLEQEPCDDCVSRQTVIDMMNYGILEDNIKELPPVTPKEKTVIETLEKIKEEIKQIRIHYGYIDVQGLTIIKVLEIIDRHFVRDEK